MRKKLLSIFTTMALLAPTVATMPVNALGAQTADTTGSFTAIDPTTEYETLLLNNTDYRQSVTPEYVTIPHDNYSLSYDFLFANGSGSSCNYNYGFAWNVNGRRFVIIRSGTNMQIGVMDMGGGFITSAAGGVSVKVDGPSSLEKYMHSYDSNNYVSIPKASDALPEFVNSGEYQTFYKATEVITIAPFCNRGQTSSGVDEYKVTPEMRKITFDNGTADPADDYAEYHIYEDGRYFCSFAFEGEVKGVALQVPVTAKDDGRISNVQLKLNTKYTQGLQKQELMDGPIEMGVNDEMKFTHSAFAYSGSGTSYKADISGAGVQFEYGDYAVAISRRNYGFTCYTINKSTATIDQTFPMFAKLSDSYDTCGSDYGVTAEWKAFDIVSNKTKASAGKWLGNTFKKADVATPMLPVHNAITTKSMMEYTFKVVKTGEDVTVNETNCDTYAFYSTAKSGEMFHFLDFAFPVSEAENTKVAVYHGLRQNRNFEHDYEYKVSGEAVAENSTTSINEFTSLREGASIRMTKETNDRGIRFSGSIQKYFVDAYKAAHDSVAFGIKLTKKDGAGNVSYAYIPVDTENEKYVLENNVYSFDCCVVNLSDVTAVYAPQVYLSYTDDGVTTYLVTDTSKVDGYVTKHVRSIRDVARAALADQYTSEELEQAVANNVMTQEQADAYRYAVETSEGTCYSVYSKELRDILVTIVNG